MSLSVENYSLIASFLNRGDRANLRAVCRNARDGVDLDNQRYQIIVSQIIARIGKEALAEQEDSILRQKTYRGKIADLDRFFATYDPPITDQDQYKALKLQLGEFRQMNPRYETGAITNQNGVLIPLQRRRFYDYLNQMLPSGKKIDEKGLDLTERALDEDLAILSEWHTRLTQGEENELLYQKVLLGIEQVRIDCETRIGQEPLLCIASAHGLTELVLILIKMGGIHR